MNNETTFGKYISEARKELSISQKELAQRIHREDGEPISPQYLNDIERDRRTPSSDHMIAEFAEALELDTDYLHYLNGKIPPDVRDAKLSEDKVAGMMKSFRKKVK